MIGYSESEVFRKFALADLNTARNLVDRLPGRDWKKRWVRCHELVRALAPYLSPKWEIRDGYYYTVDHSWLETFDGNGGHIILDAYSVARLPQVQLVDVGAHFHHDAFRPGPRRRDIRHVVIAMLRKQLFPYGAKR